MVLTYKNNDAARSLDKQQSLDWHRGWQVIDPAGGSNLVTVGTGNFEYDAAAGDINAGGTTVTCSQETVDFANDIDADNDQLAVIYRDGSGNLQKTVGSTGTRDPAGQTVRQTHTPAAPSMHATDGVVLAEVLLPAGASSIGSDELRDRRLGDDLDVHFASVTTEQVDLAQSADDGSDRYIVRDSGGTIIGEIYSDGTDTVFNAVSGDIDFGSSTAKNLSSVTTDVLINNVDIRFGSSTETISSGSIAASASVIEVNGEGGSADNLDNMTGLSDNQIIILRRGDADITVRHAQGGSGEFRLEGESNFALDNPFDRLTLLASTSGTDRVIELSRSNVTT